MSRLCPPKVSKWQLAAVVNGRNGGFTELAELDQGAREIRDRIALREAAEVGEPGAGGEDDAELLQNGLAIALVLRHSAQAHSKEVSPGNVTYYAIKRLRAGRCSAGHRDYDALHPRFPVERLQRIRCTNHPAPSAGEFKLAEGSGNHPRGAGVPLGTSERAPGGASNPTSTTGGHRP